MLEFNDARSFGHLVFTMPLYLDDEKIKLRLSAPVAGALILIKNEMQHHAVTPSFALGLMKRHFQPLLPVEHQDILSKMTKPTWTDIYFAFVEMVFRGGQPTGLLADVGASIKFIFTFTTLPYREHHFTEKIEINHFLDVCRSLKIDINLYPRYSDDGKFDVWRACKYCWRQPVPGRLICPTHTAGSKHTFIKLEGVRNVPTNSAYTDYKQGARQKKAYDEAIHTALNQELNEFYVDGFTIDSLIPPVGIWDWMNIRRPELAQLLSDQKKPIDDQSIIDSLLSLLHSPEGLTETQQKPYLRANEIIRANPILIWPMLLRAEAWLSVRKNLSSNKGGMRYKRAN
jgi:hypothetical protein